MTFRKWAWLSFYWLNKIFWLTGIAMLLLKQSVQSFFRCPFSDRHPAYSCSPRGGQRDTGTWQPPNPLLSGMGRSLPFASSFCNMYMGLVRDHTCSWETASQIFPWADFHVPDKSLNIKSIIKNVQQKHRVSGMNFSVFLRVISFESWLLGKGKTCGVAQVSLLREISP